MRMSLFEKKQAGKLTAGTPSEGKDAVTASVGAAAKAKFSLLTAGALVLALSGAASTSRADVLDYHGWGVRGGISSDPDQFVVGMHLEMGEMAENLFLVPNFDLGLGDDATVLTINPDIVYRMNVVGAGHLYFGGTLSLVYVNVDTKGVSGDNDDTELGIAGIAGYRFPMENPFFVDLKLGIIDDYPELKVMAGYTFTAQ